MEKKYNSDIREIYINNRPEMKEMYDRLSDQKKRYFLDFLDFMAFGTDEEVAEIDGLDFDKDATKITTIVKFWKVLHPDHMLYADIYETDFIRKKV